ncbi:MAG: HEAT repeat domain-containing protein, partial [Candidatus Bilamarchaeaceae archaeon]
MNNCEEELYKRIRTILLFGKTDEVVAIGKPAVPVLIDALKDGSWFARKNTAEALGKIGDARAVPALIYGLGYKNGSVRDRPVVVWAFGKRGELNPASSFYSWRYSLEDVDQYVRKRAAEALVKIGKPAVPVLIDALKDENEDVRYEAAEALERIGVNEEQLKEITRMLKEGKTWEEREGAAEALGKIGDARAVPVLIDALKDKDRYVRYEAAEALGKIGDARAVPVLIDALKDKDRYVRYEAAEALGKIGDARAVPVLIDALKDKDRYVRYEAAEALGKIGDARAVPVLIDALKDKDRYVRYEAAEALG